VVKSDAVYVQGSMWQALNTCERQPTDHVLSGQVAEDEKGKGKAAMFDETQPEAMRVLQRVVDEVLAVLFDSRRQSCHGLVLNNFVSCSGFKQLLAKFHLACQVLFGAVEKQESQPAADSTAGKTNGKPAIQSK